MRKALFLLLVAGSAPAGATTWRLTVETPHPEFGRTMAFVDTDSLVRTGSQIRMRIDLRIERPPGNANGIRALVTGDCADHWIQVTDGSYYAGDRLLGPVPAEPRHRAEPDTNYRTLLDRACVGNFSSGAVDPVEAVRRAWSSQ